MRIELFTEALLTDVSRMAGMGDQAVQEAGERIAANLGPAVKMHLLDLLGQVAVELSEQVEGGRVEVRLAGSDPELILVHEQAVPAAAPAAAAEETGTEEADARITLRLPSRLKERIEAAADSEGVSTNTWIIKALNRCTTDGQGFGTIPLIAGLAGLRGLDALGDIRGVTVVRGRNRLKGYGQS